MQIGVLYFVLQSHICCVCACVQPNAISYMLCVCVCSPLQSHTCCLCVNLVCLYVRIFCAFIFIQDVILVEIHTHIYDTHVSMCMYALYVIYIVLSVSSLRTCPICHRWLHIYLLTHTHTQFLCVSFVQQLVSNTTNTAGQLSYRCLFVPTDSDLVLLLSYSSFTTIITCRDVTVF